MKIDIINCNIGDKERNLTTSKEEINKTITGITLFKHFNMLDGKPICLKT
jgi:hypothetical protein